MFSVSESLEIKVYWSLKKVYLHYYAIIIILDENGFRTKNLIIYRNNFLTNLLSSKICYRVLFLPFKLWCQLKMFLWWSVKITLSVFLFSKFIRVCSLHCTAIQLSGIIIFLLDIKHGTQLKNSRSFIDVLYMLPHKNEIRTQDQQRKKKIIIIQ